MFSGRVMSICEGTPFNVAVCVKLFGTYRVLRPVGGLLLNSDTGTRSFCFFCDRVPMGAAIRPLFHRKPCMLNTTTRVQENQGASIERLKDPETFAKCLTSLGLDLEVRIKSEAFN